MKPKCLATKQELFCVIYVICLFVVELKKERKWSEYLLIP